MTERQKRFIEEYLVDMNASAAARRAGYRGKCTGSRLVGDPRIKEAVAVAVQARSEKCAVRQEKVIGELAAVAFADASDESGAALKVSNKLRALELLGKHLGLFERGAQVQEQAVVVDDLKED